MGLNVEWIYRFTSTPYGRTIPNTLFLDVGNALLPGALDQHHDSSLGESTSDLVEKYPHFVYDHLMSEWEHQYVFQSDFQGRKWNPVIIVHPCPDFDDIVAIYLVHHIIEKGVVPKYVTWLVDYASEVDQGRRAFKKEVWEPHLVYLQLQQILQQKKQSSLLYIELGLELLRTFFSLYSTTDECKKGIEKHDYTQKLYGNPWFEDVFFSLKSDPDKYLKDRLLCSRN